jgi:hypothetical protein
MKSIIDDTIDVLSAMGLKAIRVSTPPGFEGIQVELPEDSQAFFVWSKIDDNDYHFRIARFWESENPFSMWVCPTLIDALVKTRVLTNQ